MKMVLSDTDKQPFKWEAKPVILQKLFDTQEKGLLIALIFSF